MHDVVYSERHTHTKCGCIRIPVGENPICLQTTFPSLVDQKWSQILPHWLSKQISTWPSEGLCPPLSLTSPSWQTAKKLTEIIACRRKPDTELLTLTPDTCTVKMAAVVYANPSVLAVIQSGFIASTHYIVQPNGPKRLTMEGKCSCSCGKLTVLTKYGVWVTDKFLE